MGLLRNGEGLWHLLLGWSRGDVGQVEVNKWDPEGSAAGSHDSISWDDFKPLPSLIFSYQVPLEPLSPNISHLCLVCSKASCSNQSPQHLSAAGWEHSSAL